MADFLLHPWTLTLGLTGIVFLVAGWLLKQYPPKSINWLYGYRTRRSMSSQACWDFAQKAAGKEMVRSGAALLILGCAGPWIPLSPAVAVGTSLVVVIVFAMLPVLRVESALRKHFG
jgi:uncharacterized membrane protein